MGSGMENGPTAFLASEVVRNRPLNVLQEIEQQFAN